MKKLTLEEYTYDVCTYDGGIDYDLPDDFPMFYDWMLDRLASRYSKKDILAGYAENVFSRNDTAEIEALQQEFNLYSKTECLTSKELLDNAYVWCYDYLVENTDFFAVDREEYDEKHTEHMNELDSIIWEMEPETGFNYIKGYKGTI